MVQRLTAMLALVVLSAICSQSLGAPPDSSNPGAQSIRHSPYIVLDVPEFTTDQNLILKRKNEIQNGLSSEAKAFKNAQAAYDVLSKPDLKFQLDLTTAEGRSKLINYYEALRFDPKQPTDIQAKVNFIKEALNPSGLTLTSDQQRRVAAVNKALDGMYATLTDRKAVAKYDIWLQKEYQNRISQQMKDQMYNPLNQDLSPLAMKGRKFLSFGAGQVGFMLGMTTQELLQCEITRDQSVCWAAWESWKDFNGFSNLVTFGLGAEVGTKTYQWYAEKYLDKGPNAPTNNGLIVGSVLSHIWGKFWNDKQRKVFWDYYQENQANIKEFGGHVRQREYFKRKLNDRYVIITHSKNPNDPKVIAAKKDLATINTEYNNEINAVYKFRSEYIDSFDSFMKSAAKNWSWDELEEMGLSMGRMFITVKSIDLIEHLFSGAYAEWLLKKEYDVDGKVIDDGPRLKKLMSVMKLEEKTQFEDLMSRVSFLEKLKKDHPGEFEDVEKFVKELAEKNPQRIDIAKRFYKKYIIDHVSEQIDEIKPSVIRVPVAAARDEVGKFTERYWPEITDDIEITGSLGRRVFAGTLIMQVWASAKSAIPFLFGQAFVDKVAEESAGAVLLQGRLEKITAKLGPLVTPIIKDHDFHKFYEFREDLAQYDEIWGKYREQVIARDVMADVQSWQKMRETEGHEHYLETKWLAWMLRGSSLDDPEFKANGEPDPNAAWHVDPTIFPHLFQEQKDKYGSIVKPWSTDYVQGYLDYHQFVEDSFEFPNAVMMHKKISSKIEAVFYGNQVPGWINATNDIYHPLANTVNALGDLLKPAADSVLWTKMASGEYFNDADVAWPNAKADISRKKLDLPGNFAVSYIEQMDYLHQRCASILNNIPDDQLTIFALQLKLVCTITPHPNMAYYNKLFESDLYKELAGLLSGFLVVRDPDDWVDGIAVALANEFLKTKVEGSGLKERLAPLIGQPENKEQAKAQQQLEDQKAAATSQMQAIGDDQGLNNFLEEGRPPHPTARQDAKELLQQLKKQQNNK